MKITPVNIALFAALGVQAPLMAEMLSDEEMAAREASIERITITEIIPQNTTTVPGSLVVIDRADIERQRPFSIKEALENVAGINVVGEDVFSTHLNIGMRGLNPRRSARTLLMEDGMPLYLAPYGDPSAHYSPPLDGVQRIEVVKGSGQILYGPQTIGGMINFVTMPVPTDGIAGTVTAELGNNDFQSLYARVGMGNDTGGLVLSAVDKSGDGIRDNHRLNLTEYSVKGLLNITDKQSITAKYSIFEENSNTSETGLSQAEYDANPFQAPTGRIDRFDQQRDTLQIVHQYNIAEDIALSTQFYRVDNDRASFRQINNPGEPIEYCPTTEGLQDVRGARRDRPATPENAIECGGRWRPRDFSYWGIEPRLTFNHQWLGVDSEAVIGFRYHSEDIERNQFRGYDARFQSLDFARTYTGVNRSDRRAGWHNEQIQTEVTARAYYAQNSFQLGQWTVTPGLRFEDVTWTTDYIRTEGEAPTNPEKRFTLNYTKLLPGIGITYEGFADTTVFAGIHKGFAPARPNRDIEADEPDASFLATSPEESTNYELGLRSSAITATQIDATLFFTDFDEIVIQSTQGRYVNAGNSRQAGIEVAGQINFSELYNTGYNVYIQGNYTNVFLAEFSSLRQIFDDTGENIIPTSSFEPGNRLPYAPRQMLNVALGYENEARNFDARIAVNYVSEQFVDAANTRVPSADGTEGTVPSYALINLTLNYRPTEQVSLYLNAQNLADREYLASRVDGMVAGRQRQVTAGVNYRF